MTGMLRGMSAQGHTTELGDAFRRARRAGPGSTVEVVDRGGRRTIYEIVAQAPAPAPEWVTIGSPEGLALLGARRGDVLTIPAENGRRRRVSVVDVAQPARTRDEELPPF